LALYKNLQIKDAGANNMSDDTKEIDEQKMVASDKVIMGLLFGIVAILSIWFLSGGLLYVILK
jgi:hypothetical protein